VKGGVDVEVEREPRKTRKRRKNEGEGGNVKRSGVRWRGDRGAGTAKDAEKGERDEGEEGWRVGWTWRWSGNRERCEKGERMRERRDVKGQG
jgi:hypothetical protein